MRFDHPEDEEGKFGFWSTDADPFDSTPPSVAAYFHQEIATQQEPPFSRKLFVVTKASSDGAENRIDLNDDVVERHYDCVIKIEGTSKVTFYYKKATETTWNEKEVTSNLPDDALRYSAAVKRGGFASNSGLGFWIFEFEIED